VLSDTARGSRNAELTVREADVHVSSPGWRRRVGVPKETLAGVLLAASLIVGFWTTASLPLLSDEPHHVAQIRLLMRGSWELVPTLTTLPGYHVILAAFGSIVGRGDTAALRFYSLVLSAVALTALVALARCARDGRATERSLQIAFVPILFPLFVLIYTDVAALLFLIIALLLQEKRANWLAGVSATLALAIRQNYIVWFGFALLLLVAKVVPQAETHGTFVGRAARIGRAIVRRETITPVAFTAAGYGMGLVLFGVFLAWNGGIAVGDRRMHPFPSLHLGNVYFALFVCFFLLLPLHVANARRIMELVRRRRTILALALALPVFLTTFAADHPYNHPDLDWWLHNAVLTFLTSSVWAKIGMFAAMSVAFLSFWVTPLRARVHYLVYPFAILSLLPAWQIEPRYYLPPLTLFLLFRVQRSALSEWSLIVYLAALNAVLFAVVASGAYFL
jgi:alpha-1,2-glucosyltransferase